MIALANLGNCGQIAFAISISLFSSNILGKHKVPFSGLGVRGCLFYYLALILFHLSFGYTE